MGQEGEEGEDADLALARALQAQYNEEEDDEEKRVEKKTKDDDDDLIKKKKKQKKETPQLFVHAPRKSTECARHTWRGVLKNAVLLSPTRETDGDGEREREREREKRTHPRT